MSRRARIGAFAAVTLACAGIAIVATARSVDEEQAARSEAAGATARGAAMLARHRPAIVFRDLGRGAYGRLGVASPGGGERVSTGLACDRVHFAAGRGLCVTRARSVLNQSTVKILGGDLQVEGEVTVPGVPSRARVSRDGKLGSVTTFVSGHSYATPGQFSTATTLIDLEAERALGDLEGDFTTTTRAGREVTSRDRNYWGVTFAPDGHSFYATLATGGDTHLIRGDVRTRRARVIHDNVECPSLSPDATRIGYKKLVASGAGSPAIWRFTVLDLRTLRETPLAEPAPRDDQLEWLDDRNVLYGNGEETWVVPADGSGTPRRYLAAADSPAVVR